MKIKKCTYKTLENQIQHRYESRQITVDSFWENHVLSSQFYDIWEGEVSIGYFAIYKSHLITLFHLEDAYAHLGQTVFQMIMHFEQVTSAMVPSGDEWLLSHCIDHHVRIEKQAYFAHYQNTSLPEHKHKTLTLMPIMPDDDFSLLDLAPDFFDEETRDNLKSHQDFFNVFSVEHNGEWVGFGVVEYGRVVKSIASIGMFVREDKRQMGYAANILQHLKSKVTSEGFVARSGCWYYNHNSKKSMESAGGYATSRLLKFFF